MEPRIARVPGVANSARAHIGESDWSIAAGTRDLELTAHALRVSLRELS